MSYIIFIGGKSLVVQCSVFTQYIVLCYVLYRLMYKLEERQSERKKKMVMSVPIAYEVISHCRYRYNLGKVG